MKKAMPDPNTVQGKLLQDRKDLGGLRINFSVELAQTPLAKQRKIPSSRLGMQVMATDEEDVLFIRTVSEHGNWDTAVIQHNQASRLLRQPLYTVQKGDYLTAVNSANTGQGMLRQIGKLTQPYDSEVMTLGIERELQDCFEPLQVASRSTSPALPPTREALKRPQSHGNLSSSSSSQRPQSQDSVCMAYTTQPGAGWTRHGAGWPTPASEKGLSQLRKGITHPHNRGGQADKGVRVPSGNLSSMAWDNKGFKVVAPTYSPREGWVTVG